MALYSFRIPNDPYSHTRIFAYSTQTHAPLDPPSDPTLLALGIPKHFRESEMNNNNNNNIPPSEDLHNTHMREYAMRSYEIKSEGLLDIHPRLSKKTCPTYTSYCLQEKPRIPACGVVVRERSVIKRNERKKEKKKKRKDLV